MKKGAAHLPKPCLRQRKGSLAETIMRTGAHYVNMPTNMLANMFANRLVDMFTNMLAFSYNVASSAWNET